MRQFVRDIDENGDPVLKELGGGGITAVTGLDYSLTEQKTGKKWIDGKPIYEQVITGSITVDGTTAEQSVVAASNIGFDSVVSMEGFMGVNGDFIPLSNLSNERTWLYKSYHYRNQNGGCVTFRILKTAATNAGTVYTFTEIFRYTKQ